MSELNLATTTVGVNVLNGETNLIDYASGVQIWTGWSFRDGELHEGGFWVGVPARVRNSGVRAIDYRKTLDEAVELAKELHVKAAAKMARLHAAAIKLNAAMVTA